jgi:flagellar motor switch protein FliN/FliY
MTDENQAMDQDAMADAWGAALEEQSQAEAGAGHQADADELMDAAADQRPESAPLQELKEEPKDGRRSDIQLDAILDVPVTLAMEIGRTRINIRNLLQLNQGSVVELDRLAGEPMDVLVNGTLIAQGEVVVVNERFGIRLTDIVSPTDRVKQLKG